MEIPAEAKKCPYCQHYQSKLSMLMFHPVFILLFGFVPMTVVLAATGVMFRTTFDRGENFKNYSDQITVVHSEMKFGQGHGGPTVAVIGRVKNGSDVDWKDVHFQIEFRDAAGNMIDAGQEYDYSYCLPAREEAGFKVSFGREFPEASYASHSVRVIQAKDAGARF